MNEEKPIESNNTDKSSSLLGMSYAIGSIAGPVIGGKLDDDYGFKLTVYTIAALQLAFSLLYFAIAILPDLM